MPDFSYITSLKAAEDAAREGILMKALLLSAELGGQDRPENIVYIPVHAWEIKKKTTNELLSAVREGMNDVAIVPEFCGTSFVPTKIMITAACPGMAPGYTFGIGIW